MTAAANVKSNAPRAPLPAPPAVPSPPPRPMRPLAPGQMQLAEYATRHHVVTVPAGVPFEHIVDPAFWALVTERLLPCNKIDVHDSAGRYYAELIVRQVQQGRAVSGAKGGAQVHVLRYVEFEPIEVKPKLTLYEVRFLGPAQGWCVVRIADSKVMAENLEDRSTADKHVAKLTHEAGE